MSEGREEGVRLLNQRATEGNVLGMEGDAGEVNSGASWAPLRLNGIVNIDCANAIQ